MTAAVTQDIVDARIKAVADGLTPKLDLRGTMISDLGPIVELNGLQTLHLDDTPVVELAPLIKATSLEVLFLSNTKIVDCAPLASLDRLRAIGLAGTKIDDLSIFAGKQQIRSISISNTKVQDLSPLVDCHRLSFFACVGTLVSDISPLEELTHINWLDLRATEVADLRPVRHLVRLIDIPFDDGLQFSGCKACEIDPRIAEIAEIEDPAERARTLFDYLKTWVPPWETLSFKDIETRLRGPILADTLTDVKKPARDFEATALSDQPDRDPDDKFHDVVATLQVVSGMLANTVTQNRLGEEITYSFREYGKCLTREKLNARLLRFLADSVRGALNNEDTAASLDAFDHRRLTMFLDEHDMLVNGYFAHSIAPVTYEVTTDPLVLCEELFPRLDTAKTILNAGHTAGLFAISVVETLAIIRAKADAANTKVMTCSGDDYETAVADLRRAGLLSTAYVGRINGRLKQWTGADTSKRDPDEAHLYETAEQTITDLAPVFERLWKLIGNLRLPF